MQRYNHPTLCINIKKGLTYIRVFDSMLFFSIEIVFQFSSNANNVIC